MKPSLPLRIFGDDVPPTYGSGRFKFNKATSTFVVAASELTDNGKYPLLGKVYNDPVEFGLVIVSTKTLTPLAFILSEVNRDDAGAPIEWVLTLSPSLRKDFPMMHVRISNT